MTEHGREAPRHRVVTTTAEAAPGSGIGEQLALMRALVRGGVTAPAFQSAWLAARRRALEEAERAGGAVEQALEDAFWAVEDYVADPALRDPGDLDDDQMTTRIHDVLTRLDTSERSP
ncbi:colicin immunity domain-containing protein [Sphaerisporangium sp. NPDC051011]|uniref:colicin immunity domain-containing protein n=1 Tax=Sphaerisporangium sp. NPDC051011 TaxID=3155792 RepID=UPI0034006443